MAGIISSVSGEQDPFSGVATAIAEPEAMSSAQALQAGEAQQSATLATPATTPATTSAATAPTAATSYTAEQRSIDPATQTVEGRVTGLLSQNNPLLQASRTRANQDSNARGLLNSSMGVQAGEMAAYSAALPIANADAMISNDAANRNMDAINQARQFNTGAVNQQGLLQSQGALDRQMQELRATAERDLLAQKGVLDQQMQSADAATKLQIQQKQADIDRQLLEVKQQGDTAMQGLKGTQELALQGLKGDQATAVANIEATYRNLMQANDSASRIWTQSSASISAILTNPDTTPEVKQQQVDKQVALLKAGLSIAGAIANVDLVALLTFT